jgi:hypothetical protein
MGVVHGKGGAKSPRVTKVSPATKPMRGATKMGKMKTMPKGHGGL